MPRDVIPTRRTLQRAPVLLLLALVCACISNEANARYKANVATINRRFAVAAEQLDSDDQDAAEALDKLSKQLVEVEENSHVVPVDPVSDQDELENLRVSCNELSDEASDEDVDGCLTLYRHRLWRALDKRYWAADLGWIVRQLGDAKSEDQLESLFVYSHNVRLRAFIAARQRQLDASYQRAIARLRLLKRQQLQEARHIRDVQIARAQAALANAFAAFAKGFISAHSTTASDRPPAGCRSDFDCESGMSCLKQNYSSVGVCARTVDAVGVPKYELPSLDSVLTKMPSSSDCRFDADCPVGFRCQPSSGACWK